MTDLIIDKPHDAVPAVPAVPNETDLGGVRLILLPPGKVNAWVKCESHAFDINLAAGTHTLGVNSDQTRMSSLPADSLAIYPKGTEFRLHTVNPLPGVILEVDDVRMDAWLEAAELDRLPDVTDTPYSRNSLAADLGRATIRYLLRSSRSKAPVDLLLTVEALALAIASRGIAQLTAPDLDIEAEVARQTRLGNTLQIKRAVDYLETRLPDSHLSIQDVANAANMSSSHFAACFKKVMGETPYAFILRRRAQFARDLIAGTHQPLSQISYAAGFSSQAHMTTVFKRIFKATPGEVRG